jgi:catechol 2,3-dioxygenase-like lactoylglutathione lyase family enzyme
MIHHVSLGSNDLARARRFYDAVMPLLGFRLLKANDGAAHYGVGDIIFSIQTPVNGKPANPGNGVHVAFPVRSRWMVDTFHDESLKHGGSSEGAPGLRPEYDANYYGTFICDPDGNKIEALTLAAK